MKHSMPRTQRASTKTKALVTGGLVAITLAGVGGAAFAAFSATTSASQSIGSGTMAFVDISTNGAGQRLSVGASEIAPGDTIQRAVTLTNSGTVAMASATLTTAATTSSALNTDTANGLQMTIDKCSIAWTEAGGPEYTYTCGGTTSTVLVSTPVIGANQALANLDVGAAATNDLRVTLTLPGTAGNTFQDLDSVIQYTFDGQQRAGTDK
jgi:predicted ribosomally synthesized peptide with SipW-like signal peptide